MVRRGTDRRLTFHHAAANIHGLKHYRTVAAALLMESTAECVRFEQESFGALHQMLSSLDADGKVAAWDEIAMQLRQFESSSGFSGPCEMIVAVGTR